MKFTVIPMARIEFCLQYGVSAVVGRRADTVPLACSYCFLLRKTRHTHHQILMVTFITLDRLYGQLFMNWVQR